MEFFYAGLLVLLGITAVFGTMVWFGRNERVRQRRTCPRSGASAEVEVIQRYQNVEKPVRVERCDQLPDPARVDCDQKCLEATGAEA